MECISSDQLTKYEDVINQINSEFQRNQELQKKLEEEDNTIIICKLSDAKINRRLCHLDVKIFTDLTYLLVLYEGEIRNVDYLLQHSGCNYYLVEIYITQALLKKLCGTEWLINICLQNQHVYLSKTIRLSSKVPILEVLVVEANVTDCTVEAYLTVCSSDKSMAISLDKKLVDVSYHFQTCKKNLNLLDSKSRSIVQLTRNYIKNPSIPEVENLPVQECRFPCNIDTIYFKQQFIKNCYHNLGVDLLTDSENNGEFSVQFVCRIGKSVVNFSSKEICVKSNIYEMQQLKEFFAQLVNECRSNKHVGDM